MTPPQVQLLLLHGFAQTPASWNEVRELLDPTWNVLAPELPGHGETALSLGQPSPELVREQLIDLAAEADAPLIVWGYSQGARSAFDFVLEAPELVRGLIIESGAPGIADPVAHAERRSRDYALSTRIEAEPIENFVSLWENVPALGEQAPAVIEKQRQMRLSNDPAALAAALRGLGQAAYEPMWDRLGEISVPTLLMTGEQDSVYVAHAVRMAGLIPGAEQLSIPGAAHAVHIARPEAAASAAADFIAALR